MTRKVMVMQSTPSALGPSWLQKVMTETAMHGEAFVAGFGAGGLVTYAEPATIMGERYCSECGCAQFDACTHPEHGNCWWVGPNLCSHCANGWGDSGRLPPPAAGGD